MESKRFNLYELVRWMYTDFYIEAPKFEKKVISEEELERDYYKIPMKKESNNQFVIPNKELSSITPTRFLLVESRKSQYTLIPESEIYGAHEMVLSADNLDKNVYWISEKIKSEKIDNKKEEKQIGFEAFEKRFKRYIEGILIEITGISKPLNLFKVDGEYQFDLFDYEFFKTLYESYEKQGRSLVKGAYNELSPCYVRFITEGIEDMIDRHHIVVDKDSVKKKLNNILLTAEKHELQQGMIELSKIVSQIAEISGKEGIEEKIKFVQSCNERINECYQNIFQESQEYLN